MNEPRIATGEIRVGLEDLAQRYADDAERFWEAVADGLAGALDTALGSCDPLDPATAEARTRLIEYREMRDARNYG